MRFSLNYTEYYFSYFSTFFQVRNYLSVKPSIKKGDKEATPLIAIEKLVGTEINNNNKDLISQ